MSIFDRLFKRPLTKDKFAAMLLRRIRASGDKRPVRYDRDGFRLCKSDDSYSFLGNIYQEYLLGTKEEREQFIRNYLAMWHTAERPLSKDFDDVRADILPALRARSYFEIDLQLANDGQPFPVPPYETIGEHLALSLVYDCPTSMMTVNEEALEDWGLTFYEAMEVAKRNLQDKPTQYAEIGSLYASANADAYDATRMISLDFVRSLALGGDVIAMVPNRDRLYVVGSDDAESLAAMLKFVDEDVQHPRYIAGLAFCLRDDEWTPWLPPTDHPLYEQFRLHQMQTMGQMYASQATMLNKRHELQGIDVFVASFSGLKNESTGLTTSHCMWMQGISALLPEADEIFFVRPKPDGVDIVARGEWSAVRRRVGKLMEPLGMYPERWRVQEFPEQAVLDEMSDG